MGLCKTSNFSIFALTKDNYQKFSTRSYSSCVYRMMRFKGLNGKVCKMMTSHFRTVFHNMEIFFCGMEIFYKHWKYSGNTYMCKTCKPWKGSSFSSATVSPKSQ